MLGLLYKKYKSQHLTLEQTVNKLFILKDEAVFTKIEEKCIYSIDNDFGIAQYSMHGSIEEFRKEMEQFLAIYKDYTIDNFEKWSALDGTIDQILEANHNKLQLQQAAAQRKRWWKFW